MNADQEDGSNAGNPTPKDPPAVPDQSDRTAGGFGGAAPASLDLYGQSRTTLNNLVPAYEISDSLSRRHGGHAPTFAGFRK